MNSDRYKNMNTLRLISERDVSEKVMVLEPQTVYFKSKQQTIWFPLRNNSP